MFPPPQPWKALAPARPDQTYVAFTSCFALRSPLHLPSFIRYSRQIARQVEAAPGAVGYALGADLLTLRLYTLSAWESDAHLRAFVHADPHERAANALRHRTRRRSIFARWEVRGADFPLTWADALRRQRQT